jgi:predicted secreted protein with PEFG-CTERM motif
MCAKLFFSLKEKMGEWHVLDIRVFFSLAVLFALSACVFSAHAETAVQSCSGCVNNTSTQVLVIYNFQTADNPFLAGNATFLITPNPYSHTTNATDYLDLMTWFNFVVTDNAKFDSDLTPGVIEVTGVNNGTYSVMQIKGTPGFGLSVEPSASDDIFGTTGLVYVTQTFVNFTSSTNVEIQAPHVSDAVFNKMTVGGAKLNGVTISSSSDLPSAMLVTAAQKLSITPPAHVVFTSTFPPNTSPGTLITNLGIPTYSAPKEVTSQTAFVPPLFVAPVSGGGKFIVSPVIDEVQPGANILLRFDKIDQGTSHPLLDAIDLPMNVHGTNVGVSVKVDNTNPSGVAIPSGNVGMFLNFTETGDIDFGDSSSYGSNPKIHFNLEKSGNACPNGVVIYLLDSGHWHEVTPAPQRNSSKDTPNTCGYTAEVKHFSSYLVGTDSGSHSHDDSQHGSHSEHSDSHSSHTGHAHAVVGHDGHQSAITYITKDLNIFEIEYDLAKGIAFITIGTTGPIGDVEVQIYSREGGATMAHPLQDQPYEQLISEKMKKYVFEVPLRNNETFFRVSVEDSKYNINSSVNIEGTYGRVVPWFANIHDGHDTTHAEHMVEASPAEFEIKFDGGKKALTYNGMNFSVKYEMAGAITGLEVNEDSKSATFLLDAVAGGESIVQIPRSLVDAAGDDFIVFVSASPVTQVDYEILASNSEYYTLKMTLPEGAKTLTIIGTSVVPEFGILAMLVLAVSLVCTIFVRRNVLFRA